jgi:hypothetical protein
MFGGFAPAGLAQFWDYEGHTKRTSVQSSRLLQAPEPFFFRNANILLPGPFAPHSRNFVINSQRELLFPFSVPFWGNHRSETMQAAIDRVMTTYGMLVHLTADQERETRERVARFLQDKGSDERMLAVEGLKYLRLVR